MKQKQNKQQTESNNNLEKSCLISQLDSSIKYMLKKL